MVITNETFFRSKITAREEISCSSPAWRISYSIMFGSLQQQREAAQEPSLCGVIRKALEHFTLPC